MAKLVYPLTVTTFSQKDCNFIMSPVLKVALSRSGVVNTIPHALVFAPLGYHGLNIPDIYVEQGIAKIARLIKYGRRSAHIAACLIRHNCEAMKMEFGVNGFLFQHEPSQWDAVITPSWLKFTWKFLKEKDILIKDDISEFPLKREGDRILMEVFASKGWTDKVLYKINVCRLYLRALSISDVTDGCGVLISKNALSGVQEDQNIEYRWPEQPRPPNAFWEARKMALKSISGQSHRLTHPLGRWTTAGVQSSSWFFDSNTESLFHKSDMTISFPFKLH